MGCRLHRNCLLPSARYHGVLVVIITLIVYIPVGGQLQSFGIFVEKLNEELCPNDCILFLSWIGALTFGINRLCCWIIVSLQKRLSTCFLFFIGVVLSSAAMTFSSYVTNLSWLFLTYCFLFGVGSSMVMNSPYELIESYFPLSHKYYILATSVMNVGSPVGSILMNPLSAYLDKVESHTWRDTMQIYAALILAVGLLCGIFMRRRVEDKDEVNEKSPIKYEDLDKSTEEQSDQHNLGCTAGLLVDVNLWIFAILLLSFAIYIPKIHFIQFMESIHFDLEEAALCMSYSGAAEALLSLAVALLGDIISRHLMFLYAVSCAAVSLTSGLLVLIPNHVYVAIYCVVHGAVDGITMTLLFSASAFLAPSETVRKYIWSGTFFINGLGQILGIPLAGYIYDHTKTYEFVFYTAAGVFGLAALVFLVLAVRLRLRYMRLLMSETQAEVETNIAQVTDKTPEYVDEKSEK